MMTSSKNSSLIMENPCYSLETNLKALSGSLVLKHLKYCQHTTIEHSGNCFKLFFDDWLASFDLAKDGAHSNQALLSYPLFNVVLIIDRLK